MAKAQEGTQPEGNIPPEQEIAYHQGAINALAKEREGLHQMLQIVEATLNGHFKRLEELGVKFDVPQDKK